MKHYSASAIAILAGGCASIGGGDFAADYTLATTTVPNEWAVTLPAPAEQTDWLSQFNSETMNSLIAEALQANPSLIAARARADAASATARAARGSRLPSLSGSSSAERNFVSSGSGSSDYNDFSLGLSTSWEVDLWGQVSKRISASDKDFLANEADLEDLKLSIAGRTANAWINLSNARAQLALANDELDARKNARELTERRVATGLATTLDVRLSRSAEASAESSIARSQLNVKDAARTLEVLLGRYPSAEVNAPETPPRLVAMPNADISPMELLARRPDIAAAEARMAASGLRADLARLAMRPSLSLTGSASIRSTEVEDLLDIDQLAGRVLANLTAPIFNGGRLANESKAARFQAQAAAANYASAVLSAWEEVEGARAADISLAQQELALQVAMDEAEAAETIAERQYQQGLISIFNLIDAQTRRINANSQLLATRASRAINRINYHLALGGGDAPVLNTPANNAPAGN
ncbi:efflux transporter outer membrane subunit [Hirschia litorea]|uniref:Efflux transporter outer membrane subunit n=1 Tax=Hirschia litorea TaxID=1199156 RepID=A0ABW2ILZ9_9PROT